MTITTGSEDLDTIANATLQDLLVAGRQETQSQIRARANLTAGTFQDFSSYQYLLEPVYMSALGSGGTTVVPNHNSDSMNYGLWVEFTEFVGYFTVDMLVNLETLLQEAVTLWLEDDDEYVRETPMEGILGSSHLASVVTQGQRAFEAAMAPFLFEQYVQTTLVDAYLTEGPQVVANWLVDEVAKMIQGGNLSQGDFYRIQSESFWSAGVADVLAALAHLVDGGRNQPDDEGLPELPFDPFMPGTFNFGLQVSYRQRWLPKGLQAGEIVRTLPLGPGQTEKISIKTTQRRKQTNTTETNVSFESSSETSLTTKDSIEVINEAAEKNSYSLEASGSYGIGGFGASVKANTAGEASSSSKDTKSNLNESMEKAASKLKQDTKVVVSTETEFTNEVAQVSEITNTNDEIAVTYIYSRLQRVYEVQTRLNEANTVIMIAEKIPAPNQIDETWIRRHDWLIGRSLLDESYREDLRVIISTTADQQPLCVDANVGALMRTLSAPAGGATAGVPDYSKLPGQIPDLFETQQLAYEREVQRIRENNESRARYQRAIRRVRDHIITNILHYMRHIWQAEDRDTRQLRLSSIRVPVLWQFNYTSVSNDQVDGYYAPIVTDFARDTEPLSELIHPAGPIGFVGNYAVYHLRESERWSSIHEMLTRMQLPYLRHNVEIRFADKTKMAEIQGVVSDRRLGEDLFRVEFDGTSMADGTFKVFRKKKDGTFEPHEEFQLDDNALSFASVRLFFKEDFTQSVAFEVEVSTVPLLEDPELKALRWRFPNLDQSKEENYYTAEVLQRMTDHFTQVAQVLQRVDGQPDWSILEDNQKATIRSFYHAFILRERYSRTFALDTDNVILSRETDGLSSLEPFKLLHRMIDVVSAAANMNMTQAEAARRVKRIEEDLLGDPDVEKLTVVAASKQLHDLAALDGLQGDPDDPDTDTDV